MDMWNISIWYVLLAAVVYFVVGAVYYSPLVLAKQWMAELPPKKKDAPVTSLQMAMLVGFLATLVLVFVEAYLVHATGTFGFMRGAYLGAKLWLGFVVSTALINNMYANASKKLLAIDMGYHLIGIVLAGGILAHFVK